VSNYQPAPAGEIEVEVVAASVGEVAWKASDDNPRGECLRLRLSAGRDYAFVFADVPLDWGRMLDAVSKATGVSRDKLVPDRFVGQRARVTLTQYTGKDGSTRASVAKWLPRPSDKPTTAKAASKVEGRVSRKAPPTFGADDDIPF